MEKDPNANIINLLRNSDIYNLSSLYILDENYLDDENLNFILNNKKDLKSYFSETYPYSLFGILVSKNPKLLNKLSKEDIFSFKFEDWVKIIKENPELINKCNVVNRFNAVDWVEILKYQPQLADKYKQIYEKLSNKNLIDLIRNNKEILNFINIKKFKITDEHISDMIIAYPEYIKKLNKNKISKISVENWIEIIKVNPNLINDCPIIDRFSIIDIVDLISIQPIFIDLLPEITKLSNDDLVKLISNQPQLIEELKIDFTKFGVDYWIEILKKQPKLIDKCNVIDLFYARNWFDILLEQPKLINYCNKFNNFNSYNWYKLILIYPELLDKCDKPLSSEMKSDILKKYPNLIEKINVDNIEEKLFIKNIYNSKKYYINFIEKYIERFHDSEVLTNMIGIYPNLKEFYIKNDLWKYVDFSKLSNNIEYSILK